jgi:hypothetical protein
VHRPAAGGGEWDEDEAGSAGGAEQGTSGGHDGRLLFFDVELYS